MSPDFIIKEARLLFTAIVKLIEPKSNVDKRRLVAYPVTLKPKPVHREQAPPDPRLITQVRAGDKLAILAPTAGEQTSWDNLAYAVVDRDSNLTQFDMKELSLLALKYDIEKYKALKPYWAAGMKPKDVSAKFADENGKSKTGYSYETLSIIFRAFNRAQLAQSKHENNPK